MVVEVHRQERRRAYLGERGDVVEVGGIDVALLVVVGEIAVSLVDEYLAVLGSKHLTARKRPVADCRVDYRIQCVFVCDVEVCLAQNAIFQFVGCNLDAFAAFRFALYVLVWECAIDVNLSKNSPCSHLCGGGVVAHLLDDAFAVDEGEVFGIVKIDDAALAVGGRLLDCGGCGGVGDEAVEQDDAAAVFVALVECGCYRRRGCIGVPITIIAVDARLSAEGWDFDAADLDDFDVGTRREREHFGVVVDAGDSLQCANSGSLGGGDVARRPVLYGRQRVFDFENLTHFLPDGAVDFGVFPCSGLRSDEIHLGTCGAANEKVVGFDGGLDACVGGQDEGGDCGGVVAIEDGDAARVLDFFAQSKLIGNKTRCRLKTNCAQRVGKSCGHNMRYERVVAACGYVVRVHIVGRGGDWAVEVEGN